MIDILVHHEARYTEARAGAIARQPGNPQGAATRWEGTAFAVQVPGVPSPWLNRAVGLADPGQVEALAPWFNMPWRAETWADRASLELSGALLHAGKHPAGGDAVVLGRKVTRTYTSVEDGELELFLDTHLAGLGIPPAVIPGAKANIGNWRGLPGWHLLLARRDGIPVGTCVLHLLDETAYIADMATLPEFRMRGVQTELLAECHRRATRNQVLWARCRFGSQSHRNLLRAGLATFCTTQFWVG